MYIYICPTSGINNTTTVVWTFREASTINPVMYNLLSIRSVHNILHMLTPSVLCHNLLLNTMSDDAYRYFDLPDNPFLELFCY